ncbi:MAG: hypothetical protein WAM39_23630 [Bryobacteraceae bacterium]
MQTAKTRVTGTEAKVRRLTKEIADIDRLFYGVSENEDRYLHAGMLERKRDDMVRAIVLQLHTAIEDLLTSQIISAFFKVPPEGRRAKMSTKPGRALRKMLFGAGSLGFDMKLNFAAALGLINATSQKQLMELNTLRNRCSHNWLLKMPVRYGKGPRQRKPPLLLYQGHDLHNVADLDDFVGQYWTIYAKMFYRYRKTYSLKDGT